MPKVGEYHITLHVEQSGCDVDCQEDVPAVTYHSLIMMPVTSPQA